MWKWIFRFSALPKRWIKVTAPVWAGGGPTSFAAEGNTLLLMTARAAHAQKPVFQAATLEVVIEIPLDILRQGRALDGHLIQECRIVFLDDLVQERLFGAVSCVIHRVARHRARVAAC